MKGVKTLSSPEPRLRFAREVATVVPSGEADFLPELHRARFAGTMTSLFGEVMSKKTSNTADAKQKRGK